MDRQAAQVWLHVDPGMVLSFLSGAGHTSQRLPTTIRPHHRRAGDKPAANHRDVGPGGSAVRCDLGKRQAFLEPAAAHGAAPPPALPKADMTRPQARLRIFGGRWPTMSTGVCERVAGATCIVYKTRANVVSQSQAGTARQAGSGSAWAAGVTR